MCAIEDAEPWKVVRQQTRKARKPHKCRECRRFIQKGETYQFLAGLHDHGWEQWRWCAHCDAAAQWMNYVCSGYILGGLHEELCEHWQDGFRDIEFGRLISRQKHRWHDGRDQIPIDVPELARRMMRQQVAS
jgi:hypothetical protein